jgi:putative component of toxin-antitoxin plasmid stabilization module
MVGQCAGICSKNSNGSSIFHTQICVSGISELRVEENSGIPIYLAVKLSFLQFN